MILHLPNPSTCYDKLIIYYTQQLQQFTYHNLITLYHTRRMTSNYATSSLTATNADNTGFVWCAVAWVQWCD